MLRFFPRSAMEMDSHYEEPTFWVSLSTWPFAGHTPSGAGWSVAQPKKGNPDGTRRNPEERARSDAVRRLLQRGAEHHRHARDGAGRPSRSSIYRGRSSSSTTLPRTTPWPSRRSICGSIPSCRSASYVNPVNKGLGQNFIEASFLGRGEYYRLICGDNVEPADALVEIFKHIGERRRGHRLPGLPGADVWPAVLSQFFTFLVNSHQRLSHQVLQRHGHSSPLQRHALAHELSRLRLPGGHDRPAAG